MVDYKQMSSEELAGLFSKHDKSHGDFIRWANGYGVKISRNTVSRHATGTRGISAYVQIAYLCYFYSLPSVDGSVPPDCAGPDGTKTT